MNQLLLKSKDGASAEIFHYGAHLCSWKPMGGDEQLFLSKTSAFQEGIAIRGGVPVIFPQFAHLGSLPKHGFARTAVWDLIDTGQQEDGAAYARFVFKENIDTLLLWPYVFRLEYQVTVIANILLLDLHITNNGDTHFHFTTALHTYLQIQDIRTTRIHGVGYLHYRDAVTHQDHQIQASDVLMIDQEVDRIYANTREPIVIEQEHQFVEVSQIGFQDAVIWNPWQEKTAQLGDMQAHAYQHMLCVEAASVMQTIQLKPKETWSGRQKLVHIAKK